MCDVIVIVDGEVKGEAEAEAEAEEEESEVTLCVDFMTEVEKKEEEVAGTGVRGAGSGEVRGICSQDQSAL